MISSAELSLALRGQREKVAGWADLSDGARSSIAGALGGSALGGLAWLLRPKDRDQNQWKEALYSILSGAALGGAVGFGYSRLPDIGFNKKVKDTAKRFKDDVVTGVKNMYDAVGTNKKEAPKEEEFPYPPEYDEEMMLEEEEFRRPENAPSENLVNINKKKHPRNNDPKIRELLERFPRAYVDDNGFINIDAPVIDPKKTKYPTNTVLSWDMVGRFKDPSQNRAYEKAWRVLKSSVPKFRNMTPVGWRFNPEENSITIVAIDSNRRVDSKTVPL